MRQEVYKFIAEHEKDNWWYRARRIIFEHVLRKFIKDDKEESRLIEIGSGGGGNFEVWQKFSDFCVSVDISNEALESSKNYGYKNFVQADAENLSAIATNDASIVVFCDVLEHLDHPERVLKEAGRILKENGFLLITVPSFKFLWGGADKLSLHRKRYTKNEIKNLLEQENFQILKLSYFNIFLFPMIFFARLVERLFKLNPSLEYKPLPFFLNFLLFKIFSLEAHLLKYFNLPFGVSLLAVAKK